jgi:HEAT repeat protein
MLGAGLGFGYHGRGASCGRIFFSALLQGGVVCLLLGLHTVSSWAAPEKVRMDVEQLGAVVVDAAKPDRTRLKAAKTLAESEDPRALKYLFEAIRDSGAASVLRAALVQSLDRSPQRRPAAEFLTGLLKNPEEPPEVRAVAAFSLGALGSPESKAVLRRFTADLDPAIRLASQRALLALGGADVDRVVLLGTILTDRDQPGSARAGAAQQLAALGDPRALPFLREALGEELPPLPKPATLAEHMQRVYVVKGLVPVAAARALGELGETSVVPDLLAFAEAPEAEMRVAVFEALARLKSDLALNAARRALAEDEDQRVRRWAAVLLKELKDPETLPALRRALEEDPDPGVRLQAVQALEAMHDREAVALITAALPKEELKEVRAAMEQALSSLSAAAESGDADVNASKN